MMQIPPIKTTEGNAPTLIDLFEPQFMRTASIAATLALLILSPLSTLLGAAAGYFLHQKIEPTLQLEGEERPLTPMHSSVLILGACAAVIGLTPAGALGGFVFRHLPMICSSAIGDVAYRFASAYSHEGEVPI